MKHLFKFYSKSFTLFNIEFHWFTPKNVYQIKNAVLMNQVNGSNVVVCFNILL